MGAIRQSPLVLLALLLSAPVLAESQDAEEAAAIFLEARLLASEGSFQEALAGYSKAASLAPDDPWPRLEQARLLMRLRQLGSAARIAEELALLYPRSQPVLELLADARLLLAEEDPRTGAAAEEALGRLLELDPANGPRALELARVLQGNGRGDEAVAVLARAVELRPDPRLQSILVRLMLELGREVEAERALRELLALAPGALEERLLLVEMVSRRGDHRAAAVLLEEAPDLDLEPRLRRRLAWEYSEAGDAEAGLGAIAELVRQGVADSRLRLLEGDLLQRLGRVDEAIAALETGLALEPPNPEVAVALAALVARGGDGARSRSILEEAAARLTARGENEAADGLRARLAADLLAGGDAEAALAAVEALADPHRGLEIALDALLALRRPEDVIVRVGELIEVAPEVEARRAEALLLVGREQDGQAAMARLVGDRSAARLRLAVVVYQRLERHEAALPLLDELATREPMSIDVAFRRGAALERSGRYAEAERVLRELVAQAPDFHPGLNYLGYMLADRGENLEEALALIRRAIALDPENGSYLDSLGWALHRLGRHDEALAELERAAMRSPGEPTILEHIGDVLLALGQLGPAREAWARALAIGPEDPEAVRRKMDSLQPRSGGGG